MGILLNKVDIKRVLYMEGSFVKVIGVRLFWKGALLREEDSKASTY